MNKISLVRIHLTLGEYYYLGKKKVKLIKVTEFGYNFLDEKTNCCILKKHLYVPKKVRDKYSKTDKKMFIILEQLYYNIRECNKDLGV